MGKKYKYTIHFSDSVKTVSMETINAVCDVIGDTLEKHGLMFYDYIITGEPVIDKDAIPIEWLKKWEEKHKNDPCYCNFVTDEILADWEKENETNRCR